MSVFLAQQRHLADLTGKGRLRSPMPRCGIDFSSNDYLGLAGSDALRAAVQAALDRGVPVGSGGSRLLRGNHPEHQALEAEAAAHFNGQAALYCATGYAANAMLFGTLPQADDLIVHDALIHASAHEGMKLGRASSRSVPHNDVAAFDAAITDWRRQGGKGRVWMAIETLYSMDGDQAPLTALASVADRHEAILLIDEAHATGVLGPQGRGLAANLCGRENVVTLHTCGKALGCEGALICGDRTVIEFLVNRGRGLIFSTAPSPLMAAAVRAALVLTRDDAARDVLRTLVETAGSLFEDRLGIAGTGSQILPIILGDERRTMAMASALQASGFDVRGIRPPTVPDGTSRLRVSFTLNADIAAVEQLVHTLERLMEGRT